MPVWDAFGGNCPIPEHAPAYFGLEGFIVKGFLAWRPIVPFCNTVLF